MHQIACKLELLKVPELYDNHQQALERLAQLHPGADFVVGWVLRHETETGERAARVLFDPPELPEITDEPCGLYLMRIYLTQTEIDALSEVDGVQVVDMPSMRSRPHSTVWSDTHGAKEMRQFIEDNPVSWPDSQV